ncbi:MAG TPA: class II glutamine amidotransferase [Candidatus Thermoplasmatota archaeon]|nr:class II glutamine amidotransferase [Candidatus Thermoplasmatota archaeon]
MCRILAANSAQPIAAERFTDFPSLCTKSSCGPHRDGWGVVAATAEGPRHLGREAKPADAPDSSWAAAMARLAEGRPAGTVLAHLRAASAGLSVRLENTHPFLHGRWAFAHNGTLHDYRPELSVPAEGDTDSERLFKFLLPRLENPGPTVPTMVEALRRVRSQCASYTALTCVFTDGPRLFAIHDSTKGHEDHGLVFASDQGVLWVAQEPHFPAHWRPVENQHMLVAENGRLKGVVPLFRV